MPAKNYVKWPGSRILQDESNRLVTDIQIAAWNGKAEASHTHTKSQITDFPTSLKNPSSVTVKLNGGAAEGVDMFTYDGSTAKAIDITPVGIGAANKDHTHSFSDIGAISSKTIEVTDWNKALRNGYYLSKFSAVNTPDDATSPNYCYAGQVIVGSYFIEQTVYVDAINTKGAISRPAEILKYIRYGMITDVDSNGNPTTVDWQEWNNIMYVK